MSSSGAGGPLRRPSTCRSNFSISPYARPPSPRRPPILDPVAGGNGLFSKLVGSASRLIAGCASWILSSVLPKTITEPLDTGGSLPSNQEPREIASFIPEDEFASPAELAKAYMSSKNKSSFPVVSQQDQVFHDLTYKPVIPMLAKLYGTTDRPKSNYMTPRPLGRSAIYRMSRSPYFKSYNNDVKGSESLRPNVRQTPESSKLTGARMVLKQRSSALDYEVGSFDPLRKIHRTSSKIENPVGFQSSETEKKISQHLHEMATPPKDKSSKLVLKRKSSTLDYEVGTFGPLHRIRQKYMSPSKIENTVGNLNERHANLSNNNACVNQYQSSEEEKKIFQHSDFNTSSTKKKPALRLRAPKVSFGSQTIVTDGHSMSSSMSMLSSSKAVVSDMDAAFSFPVTPASSSYLEPPPTPSMPRPVPLKSVIPNRLNVELTIGFDTKDAHNSTSSLPIPAGTANISVDLENGTREPIASLNVEGGQEKKEGNMFKSSAESTSTSSSFSFSASTNPNLSNGSPCLPSTLSAMTSSISTTSAIAVDSQLSSPNDLKSFSSATSSVPGSSIYGYFLPSSGTSSGLGNHSTSVDASTLFSNATCSNSAQVPSPLFASGSTSAFAASSVHARSTTPSGADKNNIDDNAGGKNNPFQQNAGGFVFKNKISEKR